MQEVLWTARGKCLIGRKVNVNESLRAYVLKFWIYGLWGEGVLRIMLGYWRMAGSPQLSQVKS